MGVEFFLCDGCGESICDCGSFWRCEDCSHRLCDDCRNAAHYDEEDYGDEWMCPFCIKDMATDSDLLAFLLNTMQKTREEVLLLYQETT